MNIKGQSSLGWILAIVFVIILLFVFGFTSILGNLVLQEFNTDIQADADLSATAKNVSTDVSSRMPTTFDGAIVLFLGLLFVFSLIGAYYADVNPIAFVVVFVVTILIIIVGGIFSDTWNSLSGDGSVSTYNASFPMSGFIFDNFMVVIGVMMFTVLLVLFIKNR